MVMASSPKPGTLASVAQGGNHVPQDLENKIPGALVDTCEICESVVKVNVFYKIDEDRTVCSSNSSPTLSTIL